MPRHLNQQPLVANPKRKFLRIPGRYGSWYEERMRERGEEKSKPVGERPGNWRSVSNGDFSEEEIRELERKLGARIKRP